jgi:hypothetical protein
MATQTLSHMPLTMLRATRRSVAEAKTYQEAESQKVTDATGIVIVDGPPFLIHCPRPGCTFVGSAITDGGAVRSLAAHLVGAHLRLVK